MTYIGSKPADKVLTASDITDGVVSNAKLATDAVTEAKIADNAVLSAHIGAGDFTFPSGSLILGTSGKGIDFSATSDAGGMTSELLDDYEEGTWTGTLDNVDSGTGTGYYTKIGRQVTVSLYMASINVTSGGNAYITGLPFSAGTVFQVGVLAQNTYLDGATNGYIYNTSFAGNEENGTGVAQSNSGSGRLVNFQATYNVI